MVEDATAKGNQPATPEGSTDVAPTAVASAKATEVLLPSLSIWLASQRMSNVVVCQHPRAAPSVLSQRYGVVPKLEDKLAAESLASVEEGATAVHQLWLPVMSCFKCFRNTFSSVLSRCCLCCNSYIYML
jgi:hypothetical protein